MKTAGVDPVLWHFEGPAVCFDSQEDACEGILGGKVNSGDCVVITHEGPKGGPGMQEMLYPTSYIKSRHLGKECALITDGRFSGGTSGLSIGHISQRLLLVVTSAKSRMAISSLSIFLAVLSM
mgnify:CR=1 FL=1